MNILIIDNYDSFTYNLYQLIGEIAGTKPIVIRNDEVAWTDLQDWNLDAIVVSAGPGRPDREADFGVSRQAILELDIPLLGVCLGHQGICHLFKGSVLHAPEPVHGQLSSIHHDGSDLFANLPNPFSGVRYHSLVCGLPLPSCLRKTAWTADGLIMGIAHKSRPLWGVQFHPESICTEHGHALLINFLELAKRWRQRSAQKQSIVSAKRPSRIAGVRPDPPVTETRDRRLFVHRLRQRPDPVKLFRKLFTHQDVAIWLDSSLNGEGGGRFSIMTGGSHADSELVTYDAASKVVTVRSCGTERQFRDDLFSYLRRELRDRWLPSSPLPCDFNGGYVGYFGYEMKAGCGFRTSHRSDHPDCTLLFAERWVVLDHVEGDVYLVFLGDAADADRASQWFAAASSRMATVEACASSSRTAPAPVFTACQSRDEYIRKIEICLEHIRDGESYEICLTNRLFAATDLDPLDYYSVLRMSNPAPYSAYLKLPDFAIACSSPERFLKITPEGLVETKPIKGTMRRGTTPEEDRRLRQALRDDVKNRAENMMIVDLLRNDLGRACEIGTIHVPKLMDVETYATVHQLITTIRGQLYPGQTAVDCLRAAFPGGSMTGAPKVRTMEIIDELETDARGPYSGTIGYLGLNGAADLNIAIRTAVFSHQRVSIGVGGAITTLSDSEEEWDEAMLKAKALVSAFGSSAGFDTDVTAAFRDAAPVGKGETTEKP